MNKTFACFGDDPIISQFVAALTEAGYSETPLSHAAFVITYQPLQSALEDLYFGDKGLVAQAQANTLFIDLSPATALFGQDLYQLAQVHGAQAVSAPLIVTNPCLSDAFTPDNLTIIVGGEERSRKAALPILQVLSHEVIEAEQGTQALQMKAAHTTTMATSLLSLVEALALQSIDQSSDQVGITAQLSAQNNQGKQEPVPTTVIPLQQLLRATGTASPLQSHLLDAIEQKAYQGDYSVGILMAEVSSVVASLEAQEAVLPTLDAAFHMIELFALAGGASYNPAALHLLFASAAESAQYHLNWDAISAFEESGDTHLDDYDSMYDDSDSAIEDHQYHDHVHEHHHDHGAHHHDHRPLYNESDWNDTQWDDGYGDDYQETYDDDFHFNSGYEDEDYPDDAYEDDEELS